MTGYTDLGGGDDLARDAERQVLNERDEATRRGVRDGRQRGEASAVELPRATLATDAHTTL